MTPSIRYMSDKTMSTPVSTRLQQFGINTFGFSTFILVGVLNASAVHAQPPLTLATAVSVAQKNDLWLIGSRHSQDAIDAASVSAGTLPDPRISIAFTNMPTDTFDFGQEPMTQFKVGMSQMFPRGESLAIKQRQLTIKASQFPYQREDRKAKVAVIVSQLWLDIYKAQESIALIEKDRALFEQLADVAAASYSSAIGKTRQHDIIRAQLEMTRLEDRLTMLRQKKEMFRQKLNEWLIENVKDKDKTAISNDTQLSSVLPNITLQRPELYRSEMEVPASMLVDALSQHPAIKTLEKKVNASRAGVELARQKYKPAWGVNASYAYRDDDAMGNDRADFFSIGMSFDLPIFTDQRQDQQVKAAISKSEAVKTEKGLLIRKLKASFETARVQLMRLNERMNLYQMRLLPQVQEQAEASLTAYTNDDGDFSEVVRARIAELNASIDALNINVDREKVIARLNYFVVANDSSNQYSNQYNIQTAKK